MLLRNYKLFTMKDAESIQDMITRFTVIINELRSLGKTSKSEELVRKVLGTILAS